MPDTYKGIRVRDRLTKHETIEMRLMVKGMPYEQAHRRALDAEHRGLSKHEIQVYEGYLGSIARHKQTVTLS